MVIVPDIEVRLTERDSIGIPKQYRRGHGAAVQNIAR
jgi:hypothetical protein